LIRDEKEKINDIRGNSSNSREVFEALYLFMQAVDESSLFGRSTKVSIDVGGSIGNKAGGSRRTAA